MPRGRRLKRRRRVKRGRRVERGWREDGQRGREKVEGERKDEMIKGHPPFIQTKHICNLFINNLTHFYP